MKFLVRAFLRLLEKMGRHEVLVNAAGNIYWHRYYIFYRDRMDNPRWVDYLPNAYLHIFNTDEADGEDVHAHPWSTASLMLRGSYTESIRRPGSEELVDRETKAGRFALLSYKDFHRLAKVELGTTTLFMHGFRRSTWRFDVRKHKVICEYCQKENGGVCYKNEKVMNFTEYLGRGDPLNESFSRNRTMKWATYDAEFKKKLDRRVAAAKRIGLKPPATKQEARDILRDVMVQRAKK